MAGCSLSCLWRSEWRGISKHACRQMVRKVLTGHLSDPRPAVHKSALMHSHATNWNSMEI